MKPRRDILHIAADVIRALGQENQAQADELRHLRAVCDAQADRIHSLTGRVRELEDARRTDATLLAIVGEQWRHPSTGDGDA